MSWMNVIYKHEQKYRRKTVSYEQNQISYGKDSERQFLIDTILEEFSNYTVANVQQAVNYCCNHIIPPCETDIFLMCVQLLCEKYADAGNNRNFHA
jgi:hypothetical protein